MGDRTRQARDTILRFQSDNGAGVLIRTAYEGWSGGTVLGRGMALAGRGGFGHNPPRSYFWIVREEKVVSEILDRLERVWVVGERTRKQERRSKRVPAHYRTAAERDRHLRGGILRFPPRTVPFLRLLVALRKHAILTYLPLEAR